MHLEEEEEEEEEEVVVVVEEGKAEEEEMVEEEEMLEEEEETIQNELLTSRFQMLIIHFLSHFALTSNQQLKALSDRASSIGGHTCVAPFIGY